MPAPITDLSPDTVALVARLAEVPVGATVSWAELDATVGRKLRPRRRHLVDAALRIVLRDHAAAFVSVHGQGYHRLPPEDVAKLGARTRRRIARGARRSSKAMRQAIAGTNDLSETASRAIYREMSVLGLIAHVASERAQPDAEPAEARPTPVALVARQILDGLGGERPA